VSPEVRNILAPMAALVGVSLLVVYVASCSGAQQNQAAEPISGEAPANGVAKVMQTFPELPELKFELPKKVAAPTGPTVAEVLSRGCTTTVVRGLSVQIIEEGNCIEPGAYVKAPTMKNVAYGKAVFPYMMSPARNALKAAAKHGHRYEMKVNSMLRTVAQQYLLYDWYERGRCGIKLAAKPGKSNHQSGLAIDISSPGTWKKMLRREGFHWLGQRDRWHFDYVGKKAKVEARKGLDIQAFQRLWNRNHPDEPIRSDGGWGPATEEALRGAPASGFTVGATCRFGDGDDE
jgi:hypothetical protein